MKFCRSAIIRALPVLLALLLIQDPRSFSSAASAASLPTGYFGSDPVQVPAQIPPQDEFPEEVTVKTGRDRQVDLLVAHLEHLRLKRSWSENVFVFANANEAIATLIQSWERDDGVCSKNRKPHTRQGCLQRELRAVTHRARKDSRIDRVMEANLGMYADMLHVTPQGRLVLNLSLERELPDLTLYLKSWNKLRLQRRDSDPEGEAEKEFFRLTDRQFRRKLKGVGRVTLQEYATATYTEAQLRFMGRVLDEALKMFTASEAYIIMKQDDAPELRLELVPSDLYRLTINFIEKRIHEESANPRGQLHGVPLPELADLLMAAYLTGTLPGPILTAFLDMPEMKEHYPSFLQKAARIAKGATRILGVAFPEAYGLLNLGFVVHESFKQRDENEKRLSDQSHLIR